jgi:undecaprenyl-diphosphatase
MLENALLLSLDQRDRALFVRCVDHSRSRRAWRIAWTALTHLGGTVSSIAATVLPLTFANGHVAEAARHALMVLMISHVGVQLVKRTVSRQRPSRRETWSSLVREPDRFSFPSGHSAAAMAVAFAYALAYPTLALPLIVLAVLIGASRVFLGVHYPGDVLIGQVIAIGTALLI